MARIDYFAVAEEIESIIRDSTYIDTAPRIIIEDDVMFSAFDNSVHIMIYLTNRQPSPNQSISAGRTTRYRLNFAIWVWSSGLNPKESINKVHDLMGQVELTLMNNRTLNGKIEMLWLQGGSMTSIRPDKSRFVSGAELVIIAETCATL